MNRRLYARTARRQYGINYVEVMIATVLLAICLVPALDSVTDAIASRGVAASTTRNDILCVKSHLELVSADPYSALLSAATATGSMAVASSYSALATASCPALQVYLGRYDADNAASPYVMTDTGLVMIKVAIQDNSIVLSALATRQ